MAKSRTKSRTKKASSKRTSRRPSSRTARSVAARRPKPAKSARPRARASTRRPAARPKSANAARRPAIHPAAGVANGIGLVHHHMDYTSHVMDEVKRFYTETLGFRDFEFDPGFGYLRVLTGAGSSIGFMPPMPGPPEQWRPPREPALYLEVSDVDRAHRDLSSRGVSFLQEPTDMPWKHRVAILRDPEGRTIMLAQRMAPRGGE